MYRPRRSWQSRPPRRLALQDYYASGLHASWRFPRWPNRGAHNSAIGRIKTYFLASGFAAPFFLSCFGFIPFLSFFWLLLPFPMVVFLYIEAKVNSNRTPPNIAESSKQRLAQHHNFSAIRIPKMAQALISRPVLRLRSSLSVIATVDVTFRHAHTLGRIPSIVLFVRLTLERQASHRDGTKHDGHVSDVEYASPNWTNSNVDEVSNEPIVTNYSKGNVSLIVAFDSCTTNGMSRSQMPAII